MSQIFSLHRWTILILLAVVTLAACEDTDAPATDAVDTTQVATPDTTAAMEPGTKLNINTATQEELLTIPNVGDRMVGEFFEYRPYASILEFRREIGKYVDEEQVAAYEQYIYVPVNPDESDAATFQQLPGVDAMEAEELVAGQPYGSQESFINELANYVSEEELDEARQYLDMP